MSDPYVAKAKQDGYRSRAAYKLIEIQDKFAIFDKNSVVLDLGAAPGGWSQVVSKIAKKVVAIDLLDMLPIQNVEFIKGNFTDEDNMKKLSELLYGAKADVILSDMAPNTCGVQKVDHLRIINLLETVFDFSKDVLNKNGSIVAKVFQGGAENELLSQMKQYFTNIKHFKPISSRKESSEIYLVAMGFKF